MAHALTFLLLRSLAQYFAKNNFLRYTNVQAKIMRELSLDNFFAKVIKSELISFMSLEVVK